MAHDHIYTRLKQDERGYPPAAIEQIQAERIGGDRYRIEGTPVFMFGVARGDVVRVCKEEGDDRFWIYEDLEESGHLNARVVPLGGTGPEIVFERFKKIDCEARPSEYGLVAIDFPPGVDANAVITILEAGATEGVWGFDMGVGPSELS